MNANMNIHQYRELVRLQHAINLTGHPDLIIGKRSPLVFPVKFSVDRNTGTLTDLTDDVEPVTIVPTVSTTPVVSGEGNG